MGRCYTKYPKDKVEEYIINDTNGRGVDLVIESAGSHQALNSGIGVIKKGENY